ncbi:hypothetical protein ACT6P6_15950 [Priestia endophytica]|uniref:hypothetical protein n=1 Tax=Priestia filamentosa TaxID=1402861 RepID=UPI003D2A1159
MAYKIRLTGHLTSSTCIWLLIERKRRRQERTIRKDIFHKLNPDKSTIKLFMIGGMGGAILKKA